MSALRQSRDGLVAAAAHLGRARVQLLEAWRDDHARGLDDDVLAPLERETARLARALSAADHEVDAALRSLRHLGARI